MHILIGDEQYLTAAGLYNLAMQDAEVNRVTQQDSWSAVVSLLAVEPVDVVVFDPQYSTGFSWEEFRVIRQQHPSTRWFVVSRETDPAELQTALEAGVQVFLTKTCSREEITNALRAIQRGDKFFCNKILDIIYQTHYGQTQASCDATSLSERELEIVQLMVNGQSTKEMAGILNLSTHTVYTHRKNILRKLHLRSAQELVSYALKTGLIAS